MVGATSVALRLAALLGEVDHGSGVASDEEPRCVGVALVPTVPPAHAAGDVGAHVKPPLAWLVRQMQRVQPTLASPASVALLLPVAPTMGDRAQVLGSAVCGASLSMARTWAIELERDGVGVNCLMYEERDGDLVQPLAVVSALRALWSAPTISGQQIFTGSGTSLGRLHP